MDSNTMNWIYEDKSKITDKAIAKIEKVYEKMQDDISRKIYRNRLLFSMTNNCTFMRDVILSTDAGLKFYDQLTDDKANIYIYGAGVLGWRLFKTFPELKFKAFIDINTEKVREENKNYKIISPSDYVWTENDLIVITPRNHEDEIKETLYEIGVPSDNVIIMIDFEKILCNKQYFEEPFIENFGNGKVFVDAGCFDGNNSISFMNRSLDGTNAKIIAFEPDLRNYKYCVERLRGFKNVSVVNKGISDKNVISHFADGMGKSSVFSDEGTSSVELVKLDNVLAEDNIGYIKMDIEGEELNALKGARTIIEKHKPMLAICVYHKRWDIINIPQLLLGINSDYRFYMRHYSPTYSETVLYAL